MNKSNRLPEIQQVMIAIQRCKGLTDKEKQKALIALLPEDQRPKDLKA